MRFIAAVWGDIVGAFWITMDWLGFWPWRTR